MSPAGKSRKMVVIACVIIILIGGLFAAVTTGWLDPKDVIKKVPVISKLGKVGEIKKQAVGDAAELAALRKENKELKMQVAELTRELNQKKAQKTVSVASQQASTVNAEENTKLYRQLADYYSGMKPAAAVAILKNLDPKLVAEILKAMDREQAGQILAAMDPADAARLIELIATGEGSAGIR